MIKLKLKAFDKIKNEFISSELLHLKDLFEVNIKDKTLTIADGEQNPFYITDPSNNKVLDIIWCIYTGYNDILNNEIYEGDIIKIKGGFYYDDEWVDDKYCEVKYENGFYLQQIKSDNSYDLDRLFKNKRDITVIGNIYLK